MKRVRGKEAALSTITIAVVIVVVLAALAIPLLFWQYRAMEVHDERTVPFYPGAERIVLNINATVGQLRVDFVDLPNASARVVAEVKGHSGFFGEASPLRLDVRSINDTAKGGRNISASVSFDTYAPWPYYSLSETHYTVEVNRTLRAALNLTVVTGGVTLTTVDGVVLEGLRLNATSKGAIINLNNGTVLAGDLKIRTATGGTHLNWNNVTVQGSRVVSLGESSGLIEAKFNQHVPLQGTVSVLSKQTAGKTDIAFRLLGDTSTVVVVNEGINEAKLINNGGFFGNVLKFQSYNYPTAQSFNVQVNNTIGGITVAGQWSAI